MLDSNVLRQIVFYILRNCYLKQEGENRSVITKLLFCFDDYLLDFKLTLFRVVNLLFTSNYT